MSIEQNMDVTHRFIDEIVIGQHVEKLEEFIAPEYRLHFPGQPPQGQGGLVKLLAEIHAGFPDFFVHLKDVVAMRDSVAFLASMTGTHTGSFQGIAPTGKKMEVDGQVYLRLKNGRIIEDRPLFDRLTMLEQLGVAPSL